ncbi:MAG: NAD-dependent epimerase/dehydratase family protein [Saprospirales bacterium]|nr:NAD-dependent epimerase/dehydratase family protein [Saprospirales bacterium]MBK8490667.1 NAD-dependent epimerase/dehydratase family protein [Saprospirales bacterium]
MDKSEARIFVTGGTGFIGSYLLRYLLQEGYLHIRALRREGSRMDLVEGIVDQVEWVTGDVCDFGSLSDSMQGVDFVFHCAGAVSFDPRDRHFLRQVNVDGTANVVNAALEAGVSRLIHVSSVAALGRSEGSNRITESSKWERGSLNSWYATTKFQGEMEVWRGVEEGLSAAVVNPSVVFGSGDWKGSGTANVFHLIGKGVPFYLAGQNGFVDVRDVVRFMVLLLEKEIVGQRFILNSANWSLKELSASIARAMDRRPPWIRISAFVGEVVWRAARILSLLTGKRAVITRETITNALQKWEYLNDKSLSLGFSYIPLSQTIEETARQWMESKGEQPAVLPI